MRRFLPMLVLALAGLSARADGPRAGDGGWFWQNPLPTSNPIQGVHFVSPTMGWAIGDNGTILRTDDGGATWKYQQSGTDAYLVFGQFLGATGWVIGYRSPYASGLQTVLLATRDGGATWFPQDPAADGMLLDAHIISPLEAWLVGDAGTVRHTTNRGVTWEAVPTGAGTRLNDVYFFSPGFGWMAGGDYETSSRALLRTKDRGYTWTGGVTMPGVPLMQVGFPAGSLSVGWATDAEGKLLRTTDQGATWTPVATDARGQFFQLLNNSTGWLYGPDVWRTDDGGTTWRKLPWQTDGPKDSLRFLNAQRGYSVQNYEPYRTDDGGETWRPLFPDSPKPSFVAVSFPNAREGWVLTRDGSAWHATDAGEHWEPVATGFPPPGSPPYAYAADIAFPDSEHGWIVGVGGTIIRTEDGGRTWQAQASGATSDWREIQALDADHAWARGSYEGFVRTRDGGRTWEPLPYGGRFHFVDADTGFRVQENVVQRTTDGGLNWTDAATLDPGFKPTRLDFLDASNGLAGGIVLDSIGRIQRPILLRTRDGGATWTEQRIGADWNEPILAVRLLGPEDMWALTTAFTYRSRDDGRTWARGWLGSPWLMADVAFPDPWNGWAVGPQGTILHTRTGGLPPGDVNADGQINAADAARALAVAGGLSNDPLEAALADMDGDGRVTMADALGILRGVSQSATLEGILFTNTRHLYSPYGTHMLRSPSGALTPLISARMNLDGYDGRSVRLRGEWLPDYPPKDWGTSPMLNVTWLSVE